VKATIYRPPDRPDRRWHLGLGFNDWLAHLPVADEAPTDAADEALGVAGWRRIGGWVPHFRASWGWLVADVEQKHDCYRHEGDQQ
jgi:hypothetical protein